jgi:hypothetical protein
MHAIYAHMIDSGQLVLAGGAHQQGGAFGIIALMIALLLCKRD